jgi:hypothetical protein
MTVFGGTFGKVGCADFMIRTSSLRTVSRSIDRFDALQTGTPFYKVCGFVIPRTPIPSDGISRSKVFYPSRTRDAATNLSLAVHEASLEFVIAIVWPNVVVMICSVTNTVWQGRGDRWRFARANDALGDSLLLEFCWY